MLISPFLLRKSTTSIWCFALLLLATSLVWMPKVEAVAQLNGFQLENDEQGSVRIRLNTQQPIQVEEQRQQGIYKLILKNTTISNKMKQEGLPVVMDAQGKYIGRATQLSNNQVSITIPNGVELNQKVQVIGGASSPFISEPAAENASNEDTSFYTEAATKPTTKKPSFSKKASIAKRPHYYPLKAVKKQTLLTANKSMFLANNHEKSASKPDMMMPVAIASTVTSNTSTANTATENAVKGEAVALPATETAINEPAWLNGGETATNTVNSTESVRSIMLADITPTEPETEQLPKVPVFDGEWLAQRFLPENTPDMPLENDPFPLFPLASVAVGSALAVGLGLWAKQKGYANNLLSWLSVRTKEIPLGVAPQTHQDIMPTNKAVTSATDKVVHSLFTASLKEQLVATPPKVNKPSLQEAIAQFSPAEKPMKAQPTVVYGDLVLTAEVLVNKPKIQEAMTVSPVVQSPFRGSAISTGTVRSGSALQATLVQAIKQSEQKNEPALTQRRPAPTLIASPSTKGDFRSVTQRFSSKKFQGVY